MAETPQPSNDVLQRLRQFLAAVSACGSASVGRGRGAGGGTLWVFVALLGKPKYVTLYSGLKPEEAQNLGSRLAAKNISYEISARWQQPAGARGQTRCQPPGNGGNRACRATRAWVLSCSTLRTGRDRISPRR